MSEPLETLKADLAQCADANAGLHDKIAHLSGSLEYALGMLRTIAASGKDSSPGQLAALAQAGVDLATIGPSGCAEMRGEGRGNE